MATKSVSIKARVNASTLGAYGDTEDKAVRQTAADRAGREIQSAVESAARGVGGVRVSDFNTRYTRKGNVKATFTADVPAGASDTEVQTRVIAALNPLSQRAGAADLSVDVADVDA